MAITAQTVPAATKNRMINIGEWWPRAAPASASMTAASASNTHGDGLRTKGGCSMGRDYHSQDWPPCSSGEPVWQTGAPPENGAAGTRRGSDVLMRDVGVRQGLPSTPWPDADGPACGKLRLQRRLSLKRIAGLLLALAFVTANGWARAEQADRRFIGTILFPNPNGGQAAYSASWKKAPRCRALSM